MTVSSRHYTIQYKLSLHTQDIVGVHCTHDNMNKTECVTKASCHMGLSQER